MFHRIIPTVSMASAVLASAAIPQIVPRQSDNITVLYSSVEAAREGTTFETNRDRFESAHDTPNMTDTNNLLGFDITKPYGDRDQSTEVFAMRLGLVADYPLSPEVTEGEESRFTHLTSVWVRAPPEIAEPDREGIPREIDASWNPCFGYFYFDHDLDPADDLGDLDATCLGYLSDGEECINDIETWLAEEFQANDACPFQDDQASVKLPDSCEKVTNSELVTFLDMGPSSDLPFDRVFGAHGDGGFHIGTGSNERGDLQAYRTAGLRTVLVAAIWGYNINDTSLESEEPEPPPVTLDCLRGRRSISVESELPEEVGAAGPQSRVSSRVLMALPILIAAFL